MHGEVSRLTDPESTLALLDEHEGSGTKASDREFARRRVSVGLGNGTTVHAGIYLYKKPTRELERLPSGDFRRPSKSGV